MTEPNVRNSSRSPRRHRVLVVLFVGLLVTASPTIVVGFGDIIFDPANFAKNVQQVVALLRQIEQAGEQIRQHRLMLAHLRASVANALALAGQTLHVRLSAGPMNPIESQYPISFPQAEHTWLQTKRMEWNASQREQLLHERDLVQQVHDQMAPTAERLTTLIEASNGAHAERGKPPGQVAVAQAHEELLALYSGEMDKLLAIRALRAKRRDLLRAQQQSEIAYQRTVRDQMMADWNPVGLQRPQAVRNPF